MGDSIEDWRIEYRVAAETVDALTEKRLGTTESRLAAVEAKDTHDSLIMPPPAGNSSRGGSREGPAMVSFARPDKTD
jgi:hypothetical protein